MEIRIKTLKQEQFNVETDGAELISALKEKIRELRNIEKGWEIKLIMTGKILDDKNTVNDSGITDGCQVILYTTKPKVAMASSPVATTSTTTSTSKVASVPAPVPVPAPAQRAPISATHLSLALAQAGALPPAPAPVAAEGPVPAAAQPINLFVAAEQQAQQRQALAGHGHARGPGTGTGTGAGPGPGPANMGNMFRQQMQQNPELFLQVLLSNPQIQQFAAQDPEAFQQMINDPNFLQQVMGVGAMMDGAEGEEDNDHAVIQFTKAEKEELDDLVAMSSLSINEVVQYYLVCDRNKELAANMIMNEMLDHMNDEEEEEEEDQGQKGTQ